MMHEVPEIVIYTGLAFLLLALLLSFVRLVRGPSVNDRIAAMDLIASIVTGFIIIYSMLWKSEFYIDVVIIISLISFIGTVAISTYLRQKRKSS
ncbi:MAG TPA: monovalent cation/H+ antiporter complex subunit F [Salinivirga sp.]|uniref:monovalent cation/H+ antiporter complex subunit F n=1 Tax=Salinivirga sp. TaxID=1970192 RepID=UPI002B48FF2C|nr:monovalent cation/H+ antiporter complex subunit F [Salinivirga sp.]HKK60415.1 monovalent cation/H+ antiporter complex subunit F [Salinivirga sp.]